MVNDFRTFTAWALGVLSAILVITLLDANALRGWALGVYLALLITALLASFWRVCAHACVEAIEFLQGAIEAHQVRKRIDNDLLPRSRLIIAPGLDSEAADQSHQSLHRSLR
jgi:hypothetical protein